MVIISNLMATVCVRPNLKKNVSQALPHLFQIGCPSSVFFSDLNKKKVASYILFKSKSKCQQMNNKESASLVFDEIKKKVASSVLGI